MFRRWKLQPWTYWWPVATTKINIVSSFLVLYSGGSAIDTKQNKTKKLPPKKQSIKYSCTLNHKYCDCSALEMGRRK